VLFIDASSMHGALHDLLREQRSPLDDPHLNDIGDPF